MTTHVTYNGPLPIHLANKAAATATDLLADPVHDQEGRLIMAFILGWAYASIAPSDRSATTPTTTDKGTSAQD